MPAALAEAGLDQRILLAMRSGDDLSDPVGPGWLLRAATDLTALGGATVLTLLVLACAAFLLLSRTAAHPATARFIMATAIVLTLLIGLSRVYLGVHYPSDVLAGWCIGALWAWGCWSLSKRWR